MKAVGFLLASVLLALIGCTQMREMMQKNPGATASVLPASGSDVRGSITFTEKGKVVVVAGEITGLAPGDHGLHIHEKGDCSAPDASSAGGHFNPHGGRHGGPATEVRHGGDLGNITADASGVARFMTEVSGISLGTGDDSIIGRSVVVHERSDDLHTDPSGGSGARIGCGLVSKAN
jgi:Cu-Zn family superoxide dismutase